MKGKFLVDLVFVVVVSVLSSYLTYEYAVKPGVQSQIPKIAVLSLDREISLKDFDVSSKDMQSIALELKSRGDELSKQGFIVIDESSIVSIPEQYRAN